MQLPIDNPRKYCRQLVRESVDSATWSRNEAFTHRLADTIRGHRLHTHPIVDAWRRKQFTAESMQLVHLEVRSAYAVVFTDALLRLMQTTSQLEPKLGYKAKLAARFLILLNVVDELGGKPNPGGTETLYGHPGYSHYWQLAETLDALGAGEDVWHSYVPTPEARATRETLEKNFDDHLRLSVILAAIETVYVPYYNPWAANTVHICSPDTSTDVAEGYHSVHVDDEEGKSLDEDHSEDSWHVVRQALTPDRYAEIEKFTVETLDVWARFMDMLLRKDQELKRVA